MGGSIWLGRGTEELAASVGDPLVSQSNSLIADIDRCLNRAGISLDTVQIFACASGPGSFTGLRIGIATLKGLAATLIRPCLGIPTLEAIAHAAGESNATVAVMPAGRGEVFVQMFSVSKVEDQIVVSSKDNAVHISPAKLIGRYAGQHYLTWAGPGAHLQQGTIKDAALARGLFFNDQTAHEPAQAKRWRLAPLEKNLAKHIAALAAQAFRAGEQPLAEMLSAIYVRPSDAELNAQPK